MTKYKTCVDWLNAAKHQLEGCADTSGDQDSLGTKLDTVQVSNSGMAKYKSRADWLNAANASWSCAGTLSDQSLRSRLYAALTNYL